MTFKARAPHKSRANACDCEQLFANKSACARASPDVHLGQMKNLYTLTIENKQGEIRTVEIAANSLIHALDRLDNRCELSVLDKVKNYTCVAL